MERLPDCLLWNVLKHVSYSCVAGLKTGSRGFFDKYSVWLKSLPTTPSELRFRGCTEDGCYWLRVREHPVLLRCSGLGAAGDDGQGSVSVGLPSSRWNFCGKKSNRGGAGSNSHLHVTHHLQFEAAGKLSAWQEDNEHETDPEGHWSESGTSLKLRFLGQTYSLERTAHGDAMYGEACAGFLVSAPSVARPTAFLPLVWPNFSTLPAGGTVHGESIRTDFEAVRLLLPEMQIFCADFTYARAQGSAFIVGSGGACRTDYVHSLFGFAQGSCGPNALARIDLRGTPFSVACRFRPSGWQPRGMAKHSSNGQVVLIVGTGGQGACAPTHPGTDEAQYPCLNDGHADVLWQKGNCYTGAPFVVQLKIKESEADFEYGQCYVRDCPADWVP